MTYDETVKEIENTFGMVPGFMKDVPQNTLIQMWPLFKKYELGESLIPLKYREMIALAAQLLLPIVLTVKHFIKIKNVRS